MINVHASLLPRYRGAAPVHRAMHRRRARNGRHDHACRQGARCRSDARIRACGHQSGGDERRGRSGACRGGRRSRSTSWIDWLRAHVGEVPQNDTLATYAPRLTREDGSIDWSAAGRARSTIACAGFTRGRTRSPSSTVIASSCCGHGSTDNGRALVAPGTIVAASRRAICRSRRASGLIAHHGAAARRQAPDDGARVPRRSRRRGRAHGSRRNDRARTDSRLQHSSRGDRRTPRPAGGHRATRGTRFRRPRPLAGCRDRDRRSALARRARSPHRPFREAARSSGSIPRSSTSCGSAFTSSFTSRVFLRPRSSTTP